MFSLMIISYAFLIVVYVGSIYRATQPAPSSTIDVLERHPTAKGYDIDVPEVITAGVPFVYETKGKKLVQNGAEVRLQINCNVNNLEYPYTITTFYSNVKAGDFTIRRTATALSPRLQPSKDCTLSSIATYTFYRSDDSGNESSFTVTEVGKSNPFELIVPETIPIEPVEN